MEISICNTISVVFLTLNIIFTQNAIRQTYYCITMLQYIFNFMNRTILVSLHVVLVLANIFGSGQIWNLVMSYAR